MSYITRFRDAVAAQKPSDTKELPDEHSAAFLSLDSVLEMLRSAQSPLEAKYAARLLTEFTTVYRSSEAMIDRQAADASDAGGDIDLLRESKTLYEARVAAALLTERLSQDPPGRMLEASVSPESRATSAALSKTSVLIVEDRADDRELIAAALRKSGARVLTAQNVDEAVSIISRDSPDVVISDIELPGSSGYELMKRLRATSPRLPVLALSAKPQNAYNLKEAGFRHFFAKEEGVLREIVQTLATMPEVMAIQADVGVRNAPKSDVGGGRRPTP